MHLPILGEKSRCVEARVNLFSILQRYLVQKTDEGNSNRHLKAVDAQAHQRSASSGCLPHAELLPSLEGGF